MFPVDPAVCAENVDEDDVATGVGLGCAPVENVGMYIGKPNVEGGQRVSVINHDALRAVMGLKVRSMIAGHTMFLISTVKQLVVIPISATFSRPRLQQQ